MTDVGTTERKLSTRDKLRIWERDKGICQGCQRQLQVGDKWICEHVRALELGGSNEDGNLAVFCKSCADEKTKGDHANAAQAKRRKAKQHGMKAAPSTPIESAGFAPVDKSTKRTTQSAKAAAEKLSNLGPSNLARRYGASQ